IISSNNSILHSIEVLDASWIGVHFNGYDNFLDIYDATIVSEGRGIRTGPLHSSNVDIRYSDIRAESIGLDMVATFNSSLKFTNNEVETQWQGVRCHIGAGSYLIAGTNE